MNTTMTTLQDTEPAEPSPTHPYFSQQPRSDTATFSGTTKRSSLNSSMTNFYINTKSKRKEPSRELIRQTSLHEVVGIPPEEDSLSFTFYSTKNKFNKIEHHTEKTTEERLPTITKSTERNTPVSSSAGFVFSDHEIKQGITLDKLFGGEFKKINIFDMKSDALTNKEIFPEPEGTLDSTRCKYDHYEIVETENEEDVESRQTQRKKSKTRQTETTESVQGNRVVEVKNKIQKKYQRSVSKSLHRKKPLQFLSEYENDTLETSFADEQIEQTANNRESFAKSMSPILGEQKKARKYHVVKVKKSRFGRLDDVSESLERSQNLSQSRNNMSSQAQSAKEKKNMLMISSITFGSVRENTAGSDCNKTVIIKTKKSQPKKSLTSLNSGLLEESQEEESVLPLVPTKNNGNIIKVGKIFMNSLQSQTSKGEDTSTFKKKLIRDSKVMNQKIKMHEKEKIDRYSKMFKLNNQEKVNLLEIESSKISITQRNSTHSNQGGPDKLFERKKLMNF